MKRFALWSLAIVVGGVAVYFLVVFNWSFSSGERAGWVQKLSNKGWLCKTWEGEMAMVSLPGSTPDKFYFTVRDGKMVEQIQKAMGKRVAMQYEQKVGIPTSCFGDTRYYVTGVSIVEDIPLAPGVVVPTTAPRSPDPGPLKVLQPK